MQSEQGSREGPGEGLDQGTRHPLLGGRGANSEGRRLFAPLPPILSLKGRGCSISIMRHPLARLRARRLHARPFARLLLACTASLLLYFTLFGAILDRPLSYGYLRHEIDARLARGATVEGQKLVILAGSNGPYSHRCATIGPLLHLPCVNAGVAVGIGLDYLFLRWHPLLHPGDVVYMPMEEAQYVRSRAANALGPDAAIMLRHDHATLAGLRPRRWLGALFSYDLRGALMAIIETTLVAGGFHDPRAVAVGESNAMGDHVGHTEALAQANAAELDAIEPYHPTAAQIRAGYGSVLIARFLDWSQAHGVRVIGGLPTGFNDSPIPDATIAAIHAIYTAHGALFLELPNRSRYPRSAFFDTADHLNETWQVVHSIAVAGGLAPLVGVIVGRRDADLTPDNPNPAIASSAEGAALLRPTAVTALPPATIP